jgi:hypothetical protein
MKARAGVTAYTEPGQTDFDTALQTLNPYGSWSKIDGAWAYTPFDHEAPYTDGRWLYTEYGWYWKGNLPHSWVTEHYGYWKRGADHVWSWYPGPYWLPEIVEIRSTSTHIGWRSGAVDRDGNFIEKPEDRWAKADEWTFVTLKQFANPITPAIVAKPAEAASLLEDSIETEHTYLTYREIDRPGPHPADFLSLCTDGGMFAPITLQDKLAQQRMKSALPPGAPAKPAQVPPPGDARKVKYWITMCLPTYWSKPPADAKEGNLYIYRPDFYQDEDGIARRVALWLDPDLMRRTKQNLADLLGGTPARTTGTAPAGPAVPAIPADPASSPDEPKASDPFHSPFDDTYHGGGQRPNGASTKGATLSGVTNQTTDSNAAIPPPVGTNTAPANSP